jgi:hypothetical protein
MYKIIGVDQKEYGPVSADQLRQWLAEGRINARTQVLAEGAAEWKALGDLPEFAAAMPGPSPAPIAAPVPEAGVAQRVKGPAIALIVTASLGIAYYLISGMITLVTGGAMFHRGMPPNIPPELRGFVEGMRGPLAGVVSILIAALDGVVLLGAIKMMRLQSYGLAMAACIIALLPCQCCCVLGLPFGIWGLIVLSKAEVKSAFH